MDRKKIASQVKALGNAVTAYKEKTAHLTSENKKLETKVADLQAQVDEYKKIFSNQELEKKASVIVDELIEGGLCDPDHREEKIQEVIKEGEVDKLASFIRKTLDLQGGDSFRPAEKKSAPSGSPQDMLLASIVENLK